MTNSKYLIDETKHLVATAIKESEYRLTVSELETILDAYSKVLRVGHSVMAAPNDVAYRRIMDAKLKLAGLLDELTLGITSG
jgi:predicted enzyme related to lactoylglutathione lyase